MVSNRSYIRYTWFILGMVFLVILAGGVVRMTQSGMGCPDWPKCFGRWIPPVNESQLPADFEKYLDKQDIDHSFNVYHTWIEYINRLLGAILGLLIIVHTVWSFMRYRKSNPSIFWISFFMLLAVGFQGWLGKTVVDHNLSAIKITTHMLVALLIAALPAIILSKLRDKKLPVGNDLKTISIIAIIVVLIQVLLGTQVREQIDEISKSFKYEQRNVWIGQLDDVFLMHRSFSWLVAIVVFVLAWRSRIYPGLKRIRIFITCVILLSFFSGLYMNFFEIPAIAQPLHLFLGATLFISLFYYRLHLK